MGHADYGCPLLLLRNFDKDFRLYYAPKTASSIHLKLEVHPISQSKKQRFRTIFSFDFSINSAYDNVK